jgi:hypothetical protein
LALKRYRPPRRRRFRRTHRKLPSGKLILGALIAVVAIILIIRNSGSEDSPTAADNQNIEIPDFDPIKGNIAPSGNAFEQRTAAKPKPKVLSKPEPKVKPQIQLTKPAPANTTDTQNNITSPEAKTLIAEATAEIKAGNIIAARDKLNLTLTPPIKLSSQAQRAVKSKLTELADLWLFSRDTFPGDPFTSLYKVQSGDLLSEIGKSYNVPYELLMSINGISRPESLRADRNIKVVNGPFHAVVNKSDFTLDLYIGTKTYVKTYRVGVGEVGKDTPTGIWRVNTGKLISPPWPNPEGGMVYPEDPDYPLGTRWIGLDGLDGEAEGRTGFGIHGTKDPKTIGTRSSQGCIRLYNGDVIELFNLMTPNQSMIRVIN